MEAFQDASVRIRLEISVIQLLLQDANTVWISFSQLRQAKRSRARGVNGCLSTSCCSKEKKNMTLNTQRIHRLIPLSDLSLTQLYSARLLRTPPASRHLFIACLNPLFSLSLLSSPESTLTPPSAVFLNDLPVIISIRLFVFVSWAVCTVMVSLQWTSAGCVLCSPSTEMKEEVWPLIDLPEDAPHSLVHTDTRQNKSVNGTRGMLFYVCGPSCQSLSFHLNTLLKLSHQTKSNYFVVMLSRRSQSSVHMHTRQRKSWATFYLATFQMSFSFMFFLCSP